MYAYYRKVTIVLKFIIALTAVKGNGIIVNRILMKER